MEILGIIGARSGSKSIPDKNIKPLAGKPLMGWIIEAAKRSKYLTRIIVSTDSEKYALVARQFGAQTPFLRPLEISGDKATDFEYVFHAVKWLRENENYVPDIVVRMMPTLPFQSTEDINSCVEKLISDPEAHSAVVIAEARQHPHKALKLIDDGKGGEYLVGYFSEDGKGVDPTLRQSYPKAYFRGNIIAVRTGVLEKFGTLTGEKVRAHIIPQERALDIDSLTDFLIAEKLMTN